MAEKLLTTITHSLTNHFQCCSIYCFLRSILSTIFEGGGVSIFYGLCTIYPLNQGFWLPLWYFHNFLTMGKQKTKFLQWVGRKQNSYNGQAENKILTMSRQKTKFLQWVSRKQKKVRKYQLHNSRQVYEPFFFTIFSIQLTQCCPTHVWGRGGAGLMLLNLQFSL